MVDTDVVDKMMKETAGHKKLILDLRDNQGGAVQTEDYLTGCFLDHDIKIGDEIRRGKTKPEIAKSRKDKAFQGELIVLIDSLSASASESFARTIQIQKRGEIVGDTSAGALMTGVPYLLASARGGSNWQSFSFFGAVSVTVADFVMSDGKGLEGVGVEPDLVSVPTARALAAKTDPVLAYAVTLCGAQLSEAEAGKFHFLARVPEAGEDDQ